MLQRHLKWDVCFYVVEVCLELIFFSSVNDYLTGTAEMVETYTSVSGGYRLYY